MGTFEGNGWVEQQGKAFLWSQNRAKAKNRDALALFSNIHFSGTDHSQIGRFSPHWRRSETKVFLVSTWARSPWNLFVCLFQKGILSYHSFRLAENTSCKLCLPPGVHCFAVTLFSRTRVTHHCWDAWANRIADFPSAYWQPMCYMLHDFPQGCLCLTYRKDRPQAHIPPCVHVLSNWSLHPWSTNCLMSCCYFFSLMLSH